MRTDSLGDGHSSAEAELKVVEQRLQRERLARREGDEIAERTTRVLYDKQQELVLLEAVVETAEQAAETQALGCGFAQGYYFARPAPAGDIESLILSASSLYDKASG